MSHLKSIGIISKHEFLAAKPLLEKLIDFFTKEKIKVTLNEGAATIATNKRTTPKQLPLDKLLSSSDVIITLGGDGTILKIPQYLFHHSPPVLAINLGNKGFLSSTKPEEALLHLQDLLKENHLVESRRLLKVTHYRSNKIQKTYQALNEMVILPGLSTRIVNLITLINNQEYFRLSGDGIIIATPTGTTAHSYSTGGPVILPTTPVILINPLHDLNVNVRPTIVPDDHKITLELKSNTTEDEYPIMNIDGYQRVKLEKNDQITVEISPHQLNLVKFTNHLLTNFAQKVGNI